MFTAETAETCIAFAAEFEETRAWSAQFAAEAAAEVPDYGALLADIRTLAVELDALAVRFAAKGLLTEPLGPDFALTADEVAAEAAHWTQQAAAESYGDYLAARAAELEGDEEPGDYPDPSDEQLCRVR
jgi:hypothetical protein